MTPEQKAEAMRLAQAYAVACAIGERRLVLAEPTMPSSPCSIAAHLARRDLDSYLTALIDKPTIARIDGEGSSSLD